MSASPNHLGSRDRLCILLALLGFVAGFWFAIHGLHVELVCVAVFSLGLVQLEENKRIQVGARVREALRRADIALKVAADAMRVDQGDLTRMLNGELKLDLYRLEMLPDAFHQEWWPLLARDKGLPNQFRICLQALPFVEERSA